MQKLSFLMIVLLFCLFPSAFAQEDAMKELLSSKTLKCIFTEGRTAKWKGGNLKIETDRSTTTILFDNIDLQKKTARSIGNAGASDEAIIVTTSGITFVEQTAFGNLVFTTVFPYFNKEGHFIAVTSRHMDMVGPLPSQYHGACKKMPSS